MTTLAAINRQITTCTRCPRLVGWCQQVAREKKRAYREWKYWGKPVPSFGDRRARILIVGLAPAAHGANRTGRMFTGDQSGRWLYRALHRAGLANQPSWQQAGDGLQLHGCYITAAVHCAPPANKPTTDERAACAPYLDDELNALTDLRVIVALGKIAFDTLLRASERRGLVLPKPRPTFGHGASVSFAAPTHRDRSLHLLASYHPSQQNTNTGTLTEEMLDAIFQRATNLADR